MKMHYLADADSLVDIDREQYKQLLTTKTGHDLAKAVTEAMKVIDNDPRQSALNEADAFFPHNDVVNGFTKPAELLRELQENRLFWRDRGGFNFSPREGDRASDDLDT